MATKKATQKVEEKVIEAQSEMEEVIENGEKVFNIFVEHQKTAAYEAAKAVESLIPVGLREHGRAAVRESVEGYRTLFNSAVDGIIDTLGKAKMENDAKIEVEIN
jgi:hypothetical protein